MINIGDKLKKMRLSYNLTQKCVALENGLSPAMLSLIERNCAYASIATLSRLTKYYGVTMGWLFGNETKTNKYEIIRKNDRRLLSEIILQNDKNTNNNYCCESLTKKK